MTAVDDMAAYMGGVRAYFERARLLHRFVVTVPPARFGGRVARVLVGGPVELAAYHVDLWRSER